jgi:class 3 adenylate cyclase
VDRIDEILAAGDQVYQEVDGIPFRDLLTASNGFYVNCSALFIDVRNSSSLPDRYKRRTLAKIYRAYISEAVAVINGNADCKEIMIIGDAVSAVFDTPSEAQINRVFETAGQLNSLVDLINCRLKRNAIEPIRVGIGISYGQALMIKAGHKGSMISDVVWMGHVVNRAAKLCSLGGKDEADPPIIIDSVFADRLKADYKQWLSDSRSGYYTANVANKVMAAWLDDHCK